MCIGVSVVEILIPLGSYQVSVSQLKLYLVGSVATAGALFYSIYQGALSLSLIWSGLPTLPPSLPPMDKQLNLNSYSVATLEGIVDLTEFK